MLFIKILHRCFGIDNGYTLLFNSNTMYVKSSIESNRKKLMTSINPLTYKWNSLPSLIPLGNFAPLIFG